MKTTKIPNISRIEVGEEVKGVKLIEGEELREVWRWSYKGLGGWRKEEVKVCRWGMVIELDSTEGQSCSHISYLQHIQQSNSHKLIPQV